MTEKEAIIKGFYYTGMSYCVWNKEEEQKTKEKATAIKKKYKGADFRISPTSPYYKAIMGNQIFCDVMYYSEEAEKKYIDRYEERVAQAKEEFEERLERLKAEQEKRVARYEFIQSIKR